MLEEKAEDADGDGRRDHQPQQATIARERGIASGWDAEALRDYLHPIAKKVDQNRGQCSHVQRDVEGQARIFPAQQPGDQDQVRGA